MCSAKGMSALPPKADICGAITNVRFANGGHLSGTYPRIDLDQELHAQFGYPKRPKLIFGRQHVHTIERWSMYRHILIPTDGSELAEHAVTNGLSLAKSVGAKVTVIIVEEPFNWLGAPHCKRVGT